MARPKTHTPELRQRLLEYALDSANERGIGALTLRELADRAGTSTSAVYSCFGNKEAVQHAVLVRAFTNFALDQEGTPKGDDPITYIAGLGAQYVAWALEHPRLYEAMFGTTLAGIVPTPELENARTRAMACIGIGVQQALASGAFRPADPATVITSLWSTVHGLAALMIADQVPADADPAEAAFATIDGWRSRTDDPSDGPSSPEPVA